MKLARKKNWLLITLFRALFFSFPFSPPTLRGVVLLNTRNKNVAPDPQLSILEGNEMFTEVGSNLNLTCYIKQMPNGDDKRYFLRWSYNNQVSVLVGKWSRNGNLKILTKKIGTNIQKCLQDRWPVFLLQQCILESCLEAFGSEFLTNLTIVRLKRAWIT